MVLFGRVGVKRFRAAGRRAGAPSHGTARSLGEGRVRRRGEQVGGPFALWEDRRVLFNSRADFFDAVHTREAALAAVFGGCRSR
jgi:protein gp37